MRTIIWKGSESPSPRPRLVVVVCGDTIKHLYMQIKQLELVIIATALI